jgi:hypothetical protein
MQWKMTIVSGGKRPVLMRLGDRPQAYKIVCIIRFVQKDLFDYMPPTEAIIYVNATIFRPSEGYRKTAKTENNQGEK